MNWNRRQLWLLAMLTIAWGINWPIMKTGVTGFAPLSFRSLSMWLGLPVLWAVLRVLKIRLSLPRAEWPQLALLTLTNMLLWHVVAIISLQSLSSGRAAILGYTMPIFAALWGVALFGQRLQLRQSLGVAAAATGVTLLLWHEFGRMAGKPWAAFGMLLSAAVWGLGTHQLRRTRMTSPTLAIVFWMTALTTLVMTVLSTLFEAPRWHMPSPEVWAAIAYNAVMIFGFAQPVWMLMARTLPPAASTLSVMMIPVLGTVSGAWWLNEKLHWQDAAAVVLMLVAIATVVWPRRPAPDSAADQRA
jgi:drug/metabolite transporter (DMT)-like permease